MKLDYNLLRIFDMLMEVRNVSRTAARAGVTQSAVSHALGRLRDQIGDPLFVRGRDGLQPTPRAHEIAPRVREGLALLRQAFAPSAFDPASTERIFTISASSYFCATLLPLAVKRARVQAPLVQIRISAPGNDLSADLDEGAIDIALGGFARHPPRFHTQTLYSERLVWVGERGDGTVPLADRPRLALARQPYPFQVEELRGRDGLEPLQTVAPAGALPPGPSQVMIHDALSAGAFLVGSDLVTLLPGHIATLTAARTGVEILAPGEWAAVDLRMLWHARATPDPAHRWMREILTQAAAELEAG